MLPRAAAAFAQQAVMVLGYLKRLDAERVALQRERRVSTILQRSLLPVLPNVPGLSVAARHLVSSDEAQVAETGTTSSCCLTGLSVWPSAT
jgi:hypothetical protein